MPSSWRPSTAHGGNPGSTDAVPFSGGDLISYALADGPSFDPTSLILSATPVPGADDAELVPQWSTDLESWNTDGFVPLGQASWQFSLSPQPNQRLFLRIEVLLW